ncbi:16S rRNA (cytidine(1402)-2'-O)-methyltransferase [Fredinandcohnia quinoae]|uniref:Ribosomal RNA small subunit methyltransferase I n=1 Tax=Fredinandcohnia quinoae TaxID=2918902 RepID=A0AAW5EAE2_9BACI|nr:16S rRNA (cytidine(1402)-2'-O)-methyltransferase [Fredinandcohnia sp. SECRCQ15]MCH1626952.1 16S rRNA (cytidine(1402)-2'-O)-methyltransferase [Fredinandcohnia sp. SECRCQ15]
MWQQKSFQQNYEYGTLYLVPTPIGNLEDMTFRAIKVLKESSVIAAEDTRQTKKLCNYFEIDTPVISYHEHNKQVSGEKIISYLRAGKDVALVSDAGMPTISDPGYEVVVEAILEKFYVVPLPGANAALTALTASGISTQPFYFFGFLDRQKKEKRKQLEGLKHIQASLLFYEAPHRLKETLHIMEEVLGNRKITVSRELTKKFEEFIRGDLKELIAWTDVDVIRGEFSIIVEGSKEGEEKVEEFWWQQLSVEEHVNHYINTSSLSSKDAIKKVAKDRNQPKRDIYQEYHIE